MAKRTHDEGAQRSGRPQRRAVRPDPKTQVIRQKATEGFDRVDTEEQDYEYSVKVANRGCLIAFAGVTAVVAVVLLIFSIYIFRELGGKHATATGPVKVEVKSGYGGTLIGEMLRENGLIGNDAVFRFYSRFNGAGGSFTADVFTLEPGMSYDEILGVLTAPARPRETVWVTFPEGGTVAYYASIAEKAGLCTAEEFIYEANNGDYSDLRFFKYLEVDEDPNIFMRAEGFLAPDTYEFYVDDTAYNIVRKLFEQFNKLMTDDLYARMEEQNLTLREAITLASMVEEEASLPDKNQATVAGVFWNRLTGNRPMGELPRATLGSDVTYYYLRDWVARDYGGNYDDIPQNYIQAYLRLDDGDLPEGLPVGPISSPGRTAIDAALWPEQHNYAYFLTDFYGEYYYAQTYRQHQANIATMERRNAEWEAEQASSAAAAAG